MTTVAALILIAVILRWPLALRTRRRLLSGGTMNQHAADFAVVAITVDARQFFQRSGQLGLTFGIAETHGFNPQTTRNMMDGVAHHQNLAEGMSGRGSGSAF